MASRFLHAPCGVFLLALVLGAPVAEAQSAALAPGLAAFDQAEFQSAISALETVLVEETLPAADVELALDRVASAAFALGDDATLERSLTHLALVAPEHSFGLDVPPPLVERFAALLAATPPIELRLRAEPGDAGASRVHADVPTDPTGAVRSVLLVCGEGTSARQDEGPQPSLVAPAGQTCEATVIGPGGVELVSERLTVAARGGDRAGPGGGTTAPEGGVDGLALGLGIGGGVLALGLILGISIGVATSGGGGPDQSDVQLQLHVEW